MLKIKNIIFDVTRNVMQQVKWIRSFVKPLMYFTVNNAKFSYFNKKIYYIKIFCLMIFHDCLLMYFNKSLVQLNNYYIVLLITHISLISS